MKRNASKALVVGSLVVSVVVCRDAWPQGTQADVAGLSASCDRGDVKACGDLGRSYASCRGVQQNDREAVRLLKKACDGGDFRSCTSLGRLHADGRGGLQKDNVQAVALFRKACTAGDMGGCATLGFMYRQGHGVPEDQARAVTLYRQACEGGSALGCTNLGRMYATGTGGLVKDDRVAAGLYQKACAGGDMLGCNNLGGLHANGRGGLPKNDREAVKLFQQACTGGAMAACESLGGMYEQGRGGLPKDDAEAVGLYRRACDGACGLATASASYSLACSDLGRMYADGRGGLPANEIEAVRLFTRACDASVAAGCRNLGVMRESGRGIKKDTALAQTLYARACSLGDDEVCQKGKSTDAQTTPAPASPDAAPLGPAAQAFIQQHPEIVRQFLSDINGPQGNALLEAVSGNDWSRALALIKAGANVNATTVAGDPVLVLAALGNGVPTITALIDKGALLEATGSLGMTAYGIATAFGSTEAATYLRRRGARTDGTDPLGLTAALYARGQRPQLLLALAGMRQLLTVTPAAESPVPYIPTFPGEPKGSPEGLEAARQILLRGGVRPQDDPDAAESLYRLANPDDPLAAAEKTLDAELAAEARRVQRRLACDLIPKALDAAAATDRARVAEAIARLFQSFGVTLSRSGPGRVSCAP